MKIAVLYTCFNRKIKTLLSLRSLYSAVENYKDNKVLLEVFLTDDASTDGTSESILNEFRGKNIHILKGTGNLFWAGGMRLAWNEALKQHNKWDYYLLINDDTVLNYQCFNELFSAIDYCVKNYKTKGIVSGITCSSSDSNIITYGGDIIPNKFNGKQIRLGCNLVPQMVDLTNANILLVPVSVVDKIGIFFDGYIHSRADNDYSMLARRNGIPVLITAGVCGACDNDHGNQLEVKSKIISMTQKERTAYFNHPLHCNSDYLTFIRRNMPLRFPLSWLFRMTLTYFPKLYFFINNKRGL